MIRRWFSYAALILWFMIVVDNFFPQVQIALFGGHILVPPLALKAALLVVAVFAMLLSTRGGRVALPRSVIVLCFIFILYLLVTGLIVANRFDYPVPYIFFSYNAYYFPLIVLPLMFFLKGTLPEKV